MRFTVLIALLLFSSEILCQDAQWRGPERNGVFPDTNLLDSWPEEGPELLYVTDGLGRSFSSAVATKEAVFVTGLIDTLDVLSCLDHSGTILWQKPYGEGWDQSFPETRCTPLVDDNRVYVLSGKDNLVCFNTTTGDVVWEVNIHETYSSVWDMFGVSESPLMVDNKIIVTPGGNETAVIALDKHSGELIWKSEPLGVERSNGSPVLFRNDTMGLKLIVAMNRTHVLGVNPENGDILWTHHYNILSGEGDNTTILANSPLFHNDDILISNGWDVPSVMLEVASDGKSVREKYLDNTLDNQNHGLVRIGDFIYGSNFLTRNFGKWVCMRWETGEIMWVEEWENKGPAIAVDGRLILQDEKRGNIALVQADENAFEVVSSFLITEGKGPYWARPAVFDGRLYVRHGEALIVYNLKKNET